MPQPQEIKTFLRTLRVQVKTSNPVDLQERANAAIKKLSPAAIEFEAQDHGRNIGLLHYAIKENNPYFVRALLEAGYNTKYLVMSNASNPFAWINKKLDSDTIAIIKCLKAFNGQIDLSINHDGKRPFNLLLYYKDDFQQSNVKVELACELLPSVFTPQDFETLISLDPTVLKAVYENSKNKFSQDTLKYLLLFQINYNPINYEILKLDMFTQLRLFQIDLDLILSALASQGDFSNLDFQKTYLYFLIKLLDMPLLNDKMELQSGNNTDKLTEDQQKLQLEPVNLQTSLSIVLHRCLLAVNKYLLEHFPIEFLKDVNLFNVETSKLYHPERSTRIKKYNLAPHSEISDIEEERNTKCYITINFLFSVFHLIEQKTNKTLLQNNINCKQFLDSQSYIIKDLQTRMETKVAKTNFFDLKESYQLFQMRANWAEQFLILHLLCDSKQFGEFFLKQLYQYQPGLLAELMHIGNFEFNLFLYDKVNQIAKESTFRPSELMAALRAQKILILRQKPMTEFLANFSSSDLTSYLHAPMDIIKIILALADISKTTLSLALTTSANRSKFFFNDNFGRDLWLIQRDKLRPDLDVLPLLDQHSQFHDICVAVYKKIASSGHVALANKIQNFVSSKPQMTADELSKELLAFATADEIKIILQYPNFRKDLITYMSHLIGEISLTELGFHNSYISEKVPETVMKDIHESKVMGKNALGFWAFFQRKNDILKIIAQNQLATDMQHESAQKKQKLK